MVNPVIALQKPGSALKLFERFSVEASDGVIGSPKTVVGGGLKQVVSSDPRYGDQLGPVHSSTITDKEKIAFVELRKSSEANVTKKIIDDMKQQLTQEYINQGKNLQKSKHWNALGKESQSRQGEIRAQNPSSVYGADIYKTFFHADYTINSTPMYFLPWNPNGGAVQMELPDEPMGTPYHKHPMIFMTAMLSGCSVFVAGSPKNPTVYHCGTDSATPQNNSAADFWKAVIKELGVDPGKAKAIHNVDYITAKHHDSGAQKARNDQAKGKLNRHYGNHRKQSLEIESVQGWGAVFGIRTNRDWAFYLQENAVVSYHKIRPSEDGSGSLIPDSASRTISRPLRCRQIFPGGGNVKMLSKWRTLRF